MASQIKDIVAWCQICEKFARNNQKEPLRQEECPRYPYQIIGADLFEYGGKDYITLYDAYSNYLVVLQSKNKTSGHIIERIKSVFEIIGFQKLIRADNLQESLSNSFAETYNVSLNSQAQDTLRVMVWQRK